MILAADGGRAGERSQKDMEGSAAAAVAAVEEEEEEAAATTTPQDKTRPSSLRGASAAIVNRL